MIAGKHPGGGWHFWVDRGGTFTDVIGIAPSGQGVVRKVLSCQPDQPGDPAACAIAAMAGGQPITEVRLGTTVATNALLEHRGARVVLLINRGLGNLLRIGDQHRPDLFALAITRPRPLDVRVIEVEGRLGPQGEEITPLQLDERLASLLSRARAEGYGSCAVALMHSSRAPAHEEQLAAWLVRFGFHALALSHRLSAQPRLVPRGHTALVEAAAAPVLRTYLHQVASALSGQGVGPRLRVLCSSGALAAPQVLHAKDTILSGPAGGMVGAVAVARAALRAAGQPAGPVVGFDMGGTSTDVFHWDPCRGALAWERQPETEIAGLRLRAAMLPIHTVAAGGGSILGFEGQRLTVGPESAGADPGPAAYRRGGPATITDANLLLGRLPATALPPVFGPRGDQPADLEAVRQRLGALAEAMAAVSPGITAEQVASGALQIAIETMAAAIRRISIERGHDLREALLVSYGGAGGQHACRLASRLGVRRVLLHPLAGVLSAYGIGRAEQRSLQDCTPALPLQASTLPELERLAERLRQQGCATLQASGDLADPRLPVRCWHALELRLPGREDGLLVSWSPGCSVEALAQGFAEQHRERFGHGPSLVGEPLVVERLLVEVAPPEPPPWQENWQPLPLAEPAEDRGDGPQATVPMWLEEARGWCPVPLWRRDELQPGQRLDGPAVLLDPTSTSVLEPGWRGVVLPDRALLVEVPAASSASASNTVAGNTDTADPGRVDPTLLELYNHRFAAIAEQMGVRLQQSARSVNIRERLDFSCAVFDGEGRLVANAPHIPVHLGSMGESVAGLLAAVASGKRPPLEPGDVVLANDPFHGGTHLPDITAITPLFAPGQTGCRPACFVACRGHHADVGGITPGSMPAFSRSIAEEGLLLDNLRFLHRGELDAAAWLQRFAEGPHPVRNPEQLLADLQAQVAANRLGVVELERLIAAAGLPEVQAYMGHVQANAAEAVRRAISRLVGGEACVELDDGTTIQVAVRIDRGRRHARIDFSGTSAQHPGNLNAPLAITRAVVLYVFRCLVGEAIPLNAGCFEPLELVVPEGSLLRPRPPAAVVAGNVETSQAVANALFAALGIQAAAQGTMNNLSFGDAHRQYYETICGGTGAGVDLEGRGFCGASAVQSHMTNSRLTDPEVLEQRFPVRVETFAIRRGSGGVGRWAGGDGVLRQLRFLEPVTATLISGSRRRPPFGLAGGGAGALGCNSLIRADGEVVPLAGCTQVALNSGEALRIETPGGGAYGPVEHQRFQA